MHFDSRPGTRRGSKPAAAALLLVVALLLLALLIAPAAASGAPSASPRRFQVEPAKSWDFEKFDVDVKVNKDGSLTVRETQVANFTGTFSFLNRDLTAGKASFTDGRSYGSVRFKDIKVYDLNGQAYDNFKVQSLKGGKRVRIGFAATNEQKGWIIEYRMTGAIIYAKDYDRLYFNTVSYDRAVPVKSSRTTVTLPDGVPMDKVKKTEYPDKSDPPATLTSGVEGRTLWWEATDIAPYTTITVDVAWPKGYVAVPLTYRAWFGALVIAAVVILTLAVLAGMLLLWWRKGRDMALPELNVVQYEPPADLRPAEVGVLVDEVPKTSDLTAIIVDLAIRKKLVINELPEQGLLKKKKFGFQRWDPSTEGLADYEKELLVGLFESGDSVTEDDLKDKFYKHVSTIEKGVKDVVLWKGFFDGDPAKVKGRYYSIGALLLLLIIPVFFIRAWFDLGYLIALVPALAVCGVVVMVVGHFMPRRTAKGSETLSYVLGFKEYMATAEQEEMKFMTPENFQANLPYAMVLGVASQWANKFKDIFTEPPEWYRGYAGPFTTLYLADSLTSMQTSVGSTLTSSPSSSGGGGGGFGGGSSGGGFGGGGSSAG
jgi:uncharacterized membrane protein YgcG